MIHSCRWFTLPYSQRKLLRERRKLAKQLASLEVDNCTDWTFLCLEQTLLAQGFVDLGIYSPSVSARQASKMTLCNLNLVISRPAPKLAWVDPPQFLIFCLFKFSIIISTCCQAQPSSISRFSAASSSEVCVEISDGEHLLEIQALQDEIDLLIGQVRTIKAQKLRRSHLRCMDLFVGFPKRGFYLKQWLLVVSIRNYASDLDDLKYGSAHVLFFTSCFTWVTRSVKRRRIEKNKGNKRCGKLEPPFPWVRISKTPFSPQKHTHGGIPFFWDTHLLMLHIRMYHGISPWLIW